MAADKSADISHMFTGLKEHEEPHPHQNDPDPCRAFRNSSFDVISEPRDLGAAAVNCQDEKSAALSDFNFLQDPLFDYQMNGPPPAMLKESPCEIMMPDTSASAQKETPIDAFCLTFQQPSNNTYSSQITASTTEAKPSGHQLPSCFTELSALSLP